MQATLDGEQLAEMVEIGLIERFLAAADGVCNFDIPHGCKGWQKVELLKNKADAVFAQARTLAIAQGGKIDPVNLYAALGGPSQAAEQVEKGRFA